MGYEKLNKIIEECISKNEYKIYFDDLYKNIIPICKEIIRDNNYKPVTSNNYSKDYSLNEKIELISKFLKEIDLGLYNQFETIISSLDENKNPLVSFNYVEGKARSYVRNSDGKVYISLINNLDDIFTIIHEMFHCMNYYIINIIDDEKIITRQSYFKLLFNEGPSVIVEKLLGEWLVKNNYITQNDLNLRMNKRIKNAKICAEYVIIESIYINLKQNKINISKRSLEKYKSTLNKDSIEYKIMEEELANKHVMERILHFDGLEFWQTQRYVLAVYGMLNYFDFDKKGIEKFLKFQKLLGDSELKEENLFKL